jgi:hypothetical protein
MTFNPLKGYHGSFSSGEAAGALGAIPGANFRGDLSYAEAAERAQNHVRNAEITAEIAARTGQPQQQSSPRPNPWTGALSNVLGGVIKGFGQMGSPAGNVTNEYSDLGGFGPVGNSAAYGSFLDATAGTRGMGPLANSDVYGSFLNRQ